jgi:hypothetical protein
MRLATKPAASARVREAAAPHGPAGGEGAAAGRAPAGVLAAVELVPRADAPQAASISISSAAARDLPARLSANVPERFGR